MITVADVEAKIEEIKVAREDAEQHIKEDRLYLQVIRAIAHESSDEWASAIAMAALETQNLDITHWYE
jgi:hypothetical protein